MEKQQNTRELRPGVRSTRVRPIKRTRINLTNRVRFTFRVNFKIDNNLVTVFKVPKDKETREARGDGMAAVQARAQMNYILDDQEEKNFGPLVLQAPLSGLVVPCRSKFVEFVETTPIGSRDKLIERELSKLNLLPEGMHVRIVGGP